MRSNVLKPDQRCLSRHRHPIRHASRISCMQRRLCTRTAVQTPPLAGLQTQGPGTACRAPGPVDESCGRICCCHRARRCRSRVRASHQVPPVPPEDFLALSKCRDGCNICSGMQSMAASIQFLRSSSNQTVTTCDPARSGTGCMHPEAVHCSSSRCTFVHSFPGRLYAGQEQTHVSQTVEAWRPRHPGGLHLRAAGEPVACSGIAQPGNGALRPASSGQ